MSADFPLFAQQVRANYESMVEEAKSESNDLFFVNLNRDLLWDCYLGSFPPGTNEVFRVRAEHDCSCCRQFIKNAAGIITIQNGDYMTIWDNWEGLPYPYNIVAKAMHDLVYNAAIENRWRCPNGQVGTPVSREQTDAGKIDWHHFSVDVPSGYRRSDLSEFWGRTKTQIGLFKRGLETISMDSLNTIIDLITENQLYRGEEHIEKVRKFKALLTAYNVLNSDRAKDIFLWKHGNNAATGFRNSVIGTLAVDLSEDMDVEQAVRMFETKVAPENYQRPKALVTQKMIRQAVEKIKSYGLEDSLERRHARITDVSVNDVLWVADDKAPLMKNGLAALESKLLNHAKDSIPDFSNAKEISYDLFKTFVLPHTQKMELLVENSLLGRFMSMTAPVHADSKPLFRWDNGFSWSYSGDVTDSIREKVKDAGGRVTGAELRVSLAWWNQDDLDLHCTTPSGQHIYYANKIGILDVDMNAAGRGMTRKPVENMAFIASNFPDGRYKFWVNQYSKRESRDVGFTLEIEFSGQTFQYHYEPDVYRNVACLEIVVKNRKVIEVTPLNDKLRGAGEIRHDKWGIETNTLVPVNTIITSPNHWEANKKQDGNRHTFFILDGCLNPDPVRGIYNEYLHPKLKDIRKVFEVLGSETKAPYSEEQLSGVGISSTQSQILNVLTHQGNNQIPYKLVM